MSVFIKCFCLNRFFNTNKYTAFIVSYCFPCNLTFQYFPTLLYSLHREVKLVAQSCLTLCDPVDYTVHGILQVRILEGVAFPFSGGSSQPRSWTQVSRIQANSLPAEPQWKPTIMYFIAVCHFIPGKYVHFLVGTYVHFLVLGYSTLQFLVFHNYKSCSEHPAHTLFLSLSLVYQ